MKDCTRFEELISCLIDGEISREEHSEIDAHIAVCSECRALCDDLISISDSLSGLSVEPPPELLPSVMAKIAAKNKKRTWRLHPGYFVAVAAVLVVVIFTSTRIPSLFGSKKSDDGMFASLAPSADSSISMLAPEASVDADYRAEVGMAGGVSDTSVDDSGSGKSDTESDGLMSTVPTSSAQSETSGRNETEGSQFSVPDYSRSFSSYVIIYGPVPEVISDCEILFTSANETHIAVPNALTDNLESEAREIIITGEESDISLVIVYLS